MLGHRRHAALVAADERLNKMFAAHCWSVGMEAKYCVSDEHYIPTLLATLGEAPARCSLLITPAWCM